MFYYMKRFMLKIHAARILLSELRMEMNFYLKFSINLTNATLYTLESFSHRVPLTYTHIKNLYMASSRTLNIVLL